jgi:hypothetical protein
MGKANKKPDYVIKYMGGWRSSILIGFLSGLGGTFIWFSHGMSGPFAREIATLIVTLDGIILGFTFIAVTLLLSERAYFSARMAEVLERHLGNFLQELKVVDVQDNKKVEKNLTSCIQSAIEESSAMPSTIPLSIIVLIISIFLALSLFGVNDTMTSPSLAESFFCVPFSLSLCFAMIGIYAVYKFINELVNLSIRLEASDVLKKSLDAFTKKLDDTIKKASGATENPKN